MADYPEILDPASLLIPPGVATVQLLPGQKQNVYNDPLLKTDFIGTATLIEQISSDAQIDYWRATILDDEGNPIEIIAGIKKERLVVAET